MRLLSVILLSFIVSQVFAQQEITVMQYNLLNYGNSTTFCTSSNNNLSAKDGYLRTIVDHVNPDVIIVNEMGSNAIYPQRILERSLDTAKWDQMEYSASSGSSLANMLFYRKDKLGKYGQDKVARNTSGGSLVRELNVYQLYYKDPRYTAASDTVKMDFVGVHFKAGTGSSNANQRADATTALMANLATVTASGNRMIAGDFNIYRATEDAYEDLVADADTMLRFYDPISTPGSWNNASAFAAVHTQSTRTSGSCHAGGGLDDRFDQILMSNAIKNHSQQVKYVDGSYKAVGNDGNHFNQAINNGTNNSVPSNVLTAIYEMSDHLPVVMKVAVDTIAAPPVVVDERSVTPAGLQTLGDGKYKITGLENGQLTSVYVLSLSGQHLGELSSTFDLAEYPSGIYLVGVETRFGTQQYFKVFR